MPVRAGCGLYWGGRQRRRRLQRGGLRHGIAPVGYRDPQTGTCEYFGGGGGGAAATTATAQHVCAEPATGQALPDWGQCDTNCDGLDENSCIETAGCHAAYLDLGLDALVAPNKFYGCWATAQGSSTLPPTTCAGLDAQTCSERDNCSMVYTAYNGDQLPQKFEQCIDESISGCGVDIGLPDGLRTASSSARRATAWAARTRAQPSTACPTPAGASCTGRTIDVQTCGAAVSCPANTTPGIANGCWTGYCIPNAACGSPNPGECYGT